MNTHFSSKNMFKISLTSLTLSPQPESLITPPAIGSFSLRFSLFFLFTCFSFFSCEKLDSPGSDKALERLHRSVNSEGLFQLRLCSLYFRLHTSLTYSFIIGLIFSIWHKIRVSHPGFLLASFHLKQ